MECLGQKSSPTHRLNRGDKMKRCVYPNAVARILGGGRYPGIWGTVKFYQRRDGVMVEAEINGLPRTETNFFALHIHGGDSCRGEDFSRSGTHFNPGGEKHPNHAGDLPVLLGCGGKAYMQVLTGRFHVGEVMGKTVILHGRPDDYRSQPSGDSGDKIACGVIKAFQ